MRIRAEKDVVADVMLWAKLTCTKQYLHALSFSAFISCAVCASSEPRKAIGWHQCCFHAYGSSQLHLVCPMSEGLETTCRDSIPETLWEQFSLRACELTGSPLSTATPKNCLEHCSVMATTRYCRYSAKLASVHLLLLFLCNREAWENNSRILTRCHQTGSLT